jgi:ATP-dependent DNA helicase PIF1
MTANDLHDAHRRLGLSANGAANLFMVSGGRTVRRWWSGEKFFPAGIGRINYQLRITLISKRPIMISLPRDGAHEPDKGLHNLGESYLAGAISPSDKNLSKPEAFAPPVPILMIKDIIMSKDLNHFDAEYENSPGVREVLDAITSKAPIILVSGRAGSGKSKLIRYICDQPDGKKTTVMAPTGVAALNLDATTIHKAMKLPLGVIDAENLETKRLSRIFNRIKRLIIDEISMVRADILDGIDARLRELRKNDLPFGGIQVLLVGDFLQLPPVVRDDDRNLLRQLGYETPFAFSSKVLKNTKLRVATLSKVWRQSNPEMIRILGDVRVGRNVRDAVDWLNKNCAGPHRSDATPLLLTATRRAADDHNTAGFNRLVRDAKKDPHVVSFQAERTGTFEDKNAVLPAPAELKLVRGLRVMAVKSKATKKGGKSKYVNGSLGTVASVKEGKNGLEDCKVFVIFDGDDKPTIVDAAEWSKSNQSWSDANGGIISRPVGSFKQIPLVHGYAVTIHKSQGLSLDDVRVDLGRGAFAPGQLYVALSRARSPEGLSLARPVALRDIQVDELLIRFLEWARNNDNLEFQAKA